MSVVGFDLGNHSCVVCIAIERSIGWALNDDGKTETPAVVCFGDKQRFFGIAGTKLATENPENTITQIKRLIGRQFSDPVLQRDLTSLPFKVTKGADGFPLIHAQYLREPRTFTPTQVLAMLFSNLKGVASLNFSWSESMSFENMDDEVMDCCIGIPVYFTDLQRRAVLEAATIAGLNPLRLIHETTATALVYGSCKTDLPEKDPINVAFVDVGHSSLQVCIAAFKKAHLKVLAHTFDRNLGGRDFDEVLFQHFASKFKKEYKIDVFHNARACVKLRAACEKLKKVLSTRSEFFFTEVKDVTKEFTLSTMVKIKKALRANQEIWFIERQEFERMSLQLLERVKKPLEKALSEARLKVENIHAVEVVGSGSRVPAILKILTDFFGKEPLYTLTDCECVAKGCAVQSAFLRPSYKAEDYQDFQPFQVG